MTREKYLNFQNILLFDAGGQMSFGDKFKKAIGLNKTNENTENFKHLEDLIENSSGEIVLDTDIVLDNAEKSKYPNGIEISKSHIVIDGNGHSIDAKGKTRMFFIRSSNITLKNLTFKNGNGGDIGGAIVNHSKLNIIECTFIANKAEEGGALYNMGNAKVSESTFEKNNSKFSGAALINGGNVDVKNCKFLNNSSKRHGGAISNVKNMNVIVCKFSGNVAKKGGGAIASSGRLSVMDSTFTSNVAKSTHYQGGAIFTDREKTKSLDVVDCKFEDNKPDDVREWIHVMI